MAAPPANSVFYARFYDKRRRGCFHFDEEGGRTLATGLGITDQQRQDVIDRLRLWLPRQPLVVTIKAGRERAEAIAARLFECGDLADFFKQQFGEQWKDATRFFKDAPLGFVMVANDFNRREWRAQTNGQQPAL